MSIDVEAHEHEWERGQHMAAAFAIDGRRYACAICGELRPARLVPAEDEGRLREALEIIAAAPQDAPDAIGVSARNIARAALAATPEPR